MNRQLLSLALFAVPAIAQSNAVPGLDIGMFDVSDISYSGRRGVYPNGEAGFMVGHSWCNGGTVNLPWVSEVNGVMVDSYPRIAFLLARESGGRMVQVCGKTYCKHSPTAYNFTNGPCAPCQAGAGNFFYVGCSDTYGATYNEFQYALGPTDEIDPWLGTWNPQGSYFDHGDPAVTGAAAVDSIRSLTYAQIQNFDAVKNRIAVRDAELLSGATYYGQVQAVVQGEALAERDNNLMNREVSISGTGGNYAANVSGASMSGSVLTRWQGATYALGGNGNDDGRFLVAVKVTGPVAGMYHYEYAVHNIDNNRGGASFRIPLAAGAVVQNPGFRDVDTDPLNDWTTSVTNNEIAFLATGTNAHDWNTIYNCWFDCSIAPGAGSMTIDEARVGPGALSVQVASHVPSGLSFAAQESIGSACGMCTGTAYQSFTSSNYFDLAGQSMAMTLNNGAYTVAQGTAAFVPAAGTNLGLTLNTSTTVTLPFVLQYPGGATSQLRVCSSGYASPSVNIPTQLAASTNLFLNGLPRWAAAWSVLNPSGAANVFYDANPSRAILTWSGIPFIATANTATFQLQFFPNGTVNFVWQSVGSSAFPVLTGWTVGGGHLDPGSRDLSATLPVPLQLCATPFDGLALTISADPVIGTTPQWQVAGILPGTPWGALVRSLHQAVPPIDLTPLGMPGCFSHVMAPVTTLFLTPGTTHTIAEPLPNNTAFVGVSWVGQAVTYNQTLTPLGLVASNALKISLGL
ncbi:MAG: hypothetical protein U1E73_05450 [Planctomycetota bacterium]